MIGLIRVLSTDDETLLQTHARAIQHLLAEPIVTRAIPDQPDGIHDPATLAAAEPKIVDTGRGLVADGASLIIVSCAADPAVPQLRRVIDVPVIGAGSAGAAMARSLADRIGVLGITPDVPACIANVLGDTLVADAVPADVHATTDLMTRQGRSAAVRVAAGLVEQGAECILFACTGLTTIGVAQPISDAAGVPVVDAVLAAGHAAAYPLTSPRRLA